MADLDGDSWTWWRQRRPRAEHLHFDSAAAGRSSVTTLRVVAGHTEREAVLGGYVAQAEAEPVLDRGREDLGELLGVPADGVAFVENAEAALDRLLRIWPLAEGDTVVVAPSEWGPNLHAFAERGLRIAQTAADGDGLVDLAALERLLASDPPAAVHLTQVASHRPLVQPVAAVAAICAAAGVPLWVDAAQALGHVPTACGADVVYSTSRKWLTGPRGVGVLAVAGQWWDKLRIQPPELLRGAFGTPLRYVEPGEAHMAGRIGLCNAVREFIEAGQEAVWQRLAEVGTQTREALADLPGWSVVPAPAGAGSAITGLRPDEGQSVTETRSRLLAEHSIVTTAALPGRAPREMTGPLLRVSPHVDCTADDLARLHKALRALS
ncbi:MAG TPA: aminotransferase class V-fold PLP-dependent enzyme [Streptosporangiaceae bacterium]